MIGIILATGLLASAGARVSPETLRLDVSAPAEIMVGEPVKIRTTLTAIRDVEMHPVHVQVWLDRGEGFRPYHETSFGTACTVYLPGLLKRGDAFFTERVIAVSGYAAGPEDRHFELAIPRPGRYRVRVQYGIVTSNVVTMDATLPNGEENEVLTQILRRPELLSEWAFLEELGKGVLQKLLDDFPSSRYLAYPRILAWRQELDKARAADHYAAQKKAVTWILDGRIAQLLAELEAAKIQDTPFEEDRLLLVGGAAASLGDRAKARAAYERLAWHSPNTAAGTEAKRWLASEERAAAAGLKLDVATPKSTVLPGEPIKLVLRWQAPPEAEVTLDDDQYGLHYLQVWVDDGGGFRRYCEAPRGSMEGVLIIRLPKTPRPYVQNVTLLNGDYTSECGGAPGKTFVFPKAGRYRLKLTYQPPGQPALTTSNILRFRVEPAKGDEERVLAMVRQNLWLLRTADEGKLLAQFPDSPYLSYAKRYPYWKWESGIDNRRHPDTGQSLWHLSQADWQRFARDQFRRKAQELMAEKEWGPFDEERLGQALSAAERGGDGEAAARIRAEVTERFPDSQLMQRLREDEGSPGADRR